MIWYNEEMQKRNIIRIAGVVGAILLIPLFGNIFVDGWNWGVLDFIVMGTLLFVTGLALDLAVRKIHKPIYRVGACVAIVSPLCWHSSVSGWSSPWIVCRKHWPYFSKKLLFL